VLDPRAQAQLCNALALLHSIENYNSQMKESRSQWPRGLRLELSSSARTLWSWVRIPLKAWISVCVYSVFVLPCATDWSPVQESYSLCKKDYETEEEARAKQKAVEPLMNEWMNEIEGMWRLESRNSLDPKRNGLQLMNTLRNTYTRVLIELAGKQTVLAVPRRKPNKCEWHSLYHIHTVIVPNNFSTGP
jgi:hypothetical protein